jgi:hypothetical protein
VAVREVRIQLRLIVILLHEMETRVSIRHQVRQIRYHALCFHLHDMCEIPHDEFPKAVTRHVDQGSPASTFEAADRSTSCVAGNTGRLGLGSRTRLRPAQDTSALWLCCTSRII